MKWAILITIVVLFLPFYVYILSKSATLGKLRAIVDSVDHKQEEKESKEYEKDKGEK